VSLWQRAGGWSPLFVGLRLKTYGLGVALECEENKPETIGHEGWSREGRDSPGKGVSGGGAWDVLAWVRP
jgi:hypothetical protein